MCRSHYILCDTHKRIFDKFLYLDVGFSVFTNFHSCLSCRLSEGDDGGIRLFACLQGRCKRSSHIVNELALSFLSIFLREVCAVKTCNLFEFIIYFREIFLLTGVVVNHILFSLHERDNPTCCDFGEGYILEEFLLVFGCKFHDVVHLLFCCRLNLVI